MFNRFHNNVVDQLAMINENGRFTKPSPNLPTERADLAWKKYDNDLFQTGRLITCGLYMNITLVDYVRTIVNVNRTNSTWTLDPRVDMEVYGHDGTPRGIGNQVRNRLVLSLSPFPKTLTAVALFFLGLSGVQHGVQMALVHQPEG